MRKSERPGCLNWGGTYIRIYTVSHIPGKELITADALSRVPVSARESHLDEEVTAYIRFVVNSLPATEKCLTEIPLKQEEDKVCRQVKEYCNTGWPERKFVPGTVKLYLPVASQLPVVDGLLMRGSRIVVPTSMRLEILDQLHSGHQGTNKCRRRAQQAVWWPVCQIN